MEAWDADPGWGVAAPPAAAAAPYDLYDPYGAAAPSDWQPSPTPVPRDAPWSSDPFAMSAPPPPHAPARSRLTVAGISRLTLNMTLFGLVLLILTVTILVGMRYVQSMQGVAIQTSQPTPTVAPTAVPPDGFSSLQTSLYSVAYPSRWNHKSTGDTLGCGCSLNGELFGDGVSMSFVIYTRPAAPSDQLAQVLTQAANSVSPEQTPQAVLLNQQRTYGGARWIENDYSITKVVHSTAVQLRVRVLVINFNATTYIIIASAPDASFASTNDTYFEPMLRSFRFD